MYSWEIITINCHSEKSFFFHFLLLPNEREYISTNLFILMHQKVLTSRILLISSSISFFMWELSVCRSLSLYTRAPIWRRKQNPVINGDTCIIYWMIIIFQAKPLQLFQERLLILSVNLVPNAIVHVLLKLIKWNFDIISKLIRHLIHSDFFELKAPLREICKKCRYFFN